MKKKILYGVVILLVIIQFIRPEKNASGENSKDIRNKYSMPQEVSGLLSVACNDCHSNKTNYPWYSNIQPVGWWLAGHVNDGKKELNFSTFLERPLAVQNHKLDEIIEMVDEKEMPLPAYTLLGFHADANLTDDQRKVITSWAKAQMDTLKAHYPPDSLIMKRRSPPAGQ
jgi:hypothetical protein